MSRRALSLHVTVAVVVPGCLALTAWQVDRAVTGNTLSWVYSFEWPFFAGYALYMWWRLVHEDDVVPPAGLGVSADGSPASGRESPADRGAPGRRGAGGGASDGDGPGSGRDLGPALSADADVDEELEEYNRYLAALNESRRRKRW